MCIARKVYFERVTLDDLHIAGHRRTQRRHKIAIDLNGNDAFRSRSQLAGKCARAWSDFNNSVFWVYGRQANDALEDVAVGEKVLAEALLQFA